jgi:hypothetical protein
MSEGGEDTWEEWWDARILALESVLGPADDMVGHAVIPFFLGVEAGGSADILYFTSHLPGIVSVTANLIGETDQIKNALGNYELAICHRDDEAWGPGIIAKLAYMTLETKLEPGETMGGEQGVAPDGSAIVALLLAEYGRFSVRGMPAGLLMLVGITSEELAACRAGRRAEVENALKAAKVWPYTDLWRQSVL